MRAKANNNNDNTLFQIDCGLGFDQLFNKKIEMRSNTQFAPNE